MKLARVIGTLIKLFSQILATQAASLDKQEIVTPYFASVKTNRANLHVGPGRSYKIIGTYQCKNYPIKVTASYDNWRRVEDMEGRTGWINTNLISGERYVVTKQPLVPIYNEPTIEAKCVAKAKRGVVMQLKGKKKGWSKVKIKTKLHNYTGWIQDVNLYGLEQSKNPKGFTPE